MDASSISVIVGMLGLAGGQIAMLVRLSLNHRDQRIREADAAQRQADALAVAAKLVDERTTRDRQWLLEDRKALAVDLERKVQATADVLAAKVAADNAEVARVGREHAAELALQTRHDQQMLALTVKSAEGIATVAVDELKAMVTEVGGKADAAYHEANSMNVKIEHLAEAGLAAVKAPAWDPASGDRRGDTRPTEPKA